MKKKAYLMVLALCAALAITACGTSTDQKDDKKPAAEAQDTTDKEDSGSADSKESEETDSNKDSEEAASGDTRLVSVDDVSKYVTIGEYKGLTLDNTVEAVTDDMVDGRIKEELQNKAEEVTEGSVQNGDVVTINYVGTKDGVAFDGGTANNYELTIGSGTFIDGFEDGLIGKNVGETVELNLTFPEDYTNNTDLAGKAVVFTVTINSIDTKKEMVYDDLTDEYVSENFGNSGISTVDDLKSQVSSVLEKRNYSSKMTEIQSGVLQKLLDECEVTLPDGLLDQRIAEYKERVNNAVEKSGKSFEDYMGMSEDDFNNQVSDYIEESLKQELILEAVVKDMDLSVSQKNFEEFVDSYVSSYNIADRDTFYKEYGGEDYIRLSYAENQALSKIMESVKTKVADNTDASDDADSSADAE